MAEALPVPDTSTGELVLTDYGEFVADRVRRLAPNPAPLADRWSRQPSRREVLEALVDADIELQSLIPPGADDVDPLDLLVQIAWNVPARTRAERVRHAREAHHADLEARSETARAVLEALLDRYATHGVEEITSPEVVRLPPLSGLGGPRQIELALRDDGGLQGSVEAVQEWIYHTKSAS